MADPHADMQRIEQAFVQARQELQQEFQDAGSLCGHVQQRIAATSMKPALPRGVWPALTALLLAVILLAPRGRRGDPMTPRPLAQDLSVTIGDTELIEHMAAIVGPHVVAVLWSYRGSGVTLAPPDGPGKYRVYTLRQIAMPDGRTLVCSLFIADPGVRLALDPPLMRTRSANDLTLAVSTSPRMASPAQRAAFFETAGFNGGLENILRDIQKSTP